MKRVRSLRILGCGALTAVVALRLLGQVRADTPPPQVDIYTWGANNYGQLGGVPANVTVPSPIHQPRRWVSVSVGSEHTIALTDTGEVWAWGRNTHGQLGDGTMKDSMLPVRVQTPTGITMISAGGFHNLAYRGSDGTLWAWGENGAGQIGQPSTVSASSLPLQITIASPLRAIAAGSVHSLFLTMDGTVYAWGNNANGELGVGDFNDRSSPVPVTLPEPATAIAAGGGDSMAVVPPNGQVYAWGWNVFAQLGRGQEGTPEGGEPLPAPVIEVTHAVAVTAGDFHGLALTDDGHVWGWGYDTEGQVGIGAHTIGHSILMPQILPGLDSVTAIDTGGIISVALRSNGEVWAWGNCQFGACGNNGRENLSVPSRTLLTGAVAVSAGARHMVALGPQHPSSRVVAIGASGSAFDTSPERPRARDLASVGDVIQLSSGFQHTLILDGEHRVWAYGDDTNGQLGVPGAGQADPVLVDLPLEGAVGFVEVAARANQSFALRSDGVVWAFGDGTWGQLGVGSTNPVTPPTKLPLVDVVSIAAGERHGLALDKNGIVWAWGQNRHGELGVAPTTTLTLNPTQVPAVLGPTLIAAGGFHSFAMDLIGGITAWGSGWHGQLGRESLLDSYEPVPVNVGSDVTTLSAGRYHTLVVKAGGQVMAFGDNSECQMGTWPGVDGREPTAVPGVSPSIAVQAGDYHSLALSYTGQVTAWGNDSSGQLDRGDSPLAHVDCTPKTLPLAGVTAMGASIVQSVIAAGPALAVPSTDAGTPHNPD